MLFDNEELQLIDFEYFYEEASIQKQNFPTEIIDKFLKDVVIDISKSTDIINRIITFDLPPAYEQEERYDMSSFLQDGIVKQFISVKGDNDNNPKIINKISIPKEFSVTHSYPKWLYIFKRPATVRALQIHFSSICRRDIEGVPMILFDKYRDVVIKGLLAKLLLFNPATITTMGGKIANEWVKEYEIGKAMIKTDMINELAYKSVILRTRYTL